MAVVGSAEVIVRAITSKVRDDIKKGLNDARPDVKAAGSQHGKDYASGFGDSIRGSLRNSIVNGINYPGAPGEIRGIGQQMGGHAAGGFRDSFTQNMQQVNAGQIIRNQMAGTVPAAEQVGGDAGRRGGDAFRRNISNGFGDGASEASSKLTILIGASNTVGVAIAGLVGAIGSAVAGLFALGAAAAQAAGALAVLPGALSVAAQAGATLGLAFRGIGDAVSAGLAPAPAAAGAASNAAENATRAVGDAQRALARASEDSARRIADARRALQDAYESAARASADAARRVQDAEEDLVDSERELLDARRELNDAYREGAEQLQQLAFDAEDAAISEERAALRLQDAQAALAATQGLPVDDRARVEAELAYREADLNYRQAKDRTADLAKEQKRAARNGVEGTDAVISAQENVNSAIEGVRDSEEALADARREQSQTHADNLENIADAQRALNEAQISGARSVADAQRALAAAQQSQNDAMTAGTAAASKYATALDALSPPAREFVKYLVSLKDELAGLSAAAGAELFPKLQDALEPIVSRIFPILEDELRETGSILGDVALGFSSAITSAEGLSRIRSILDGNNEIMKVFTERTETGRSAVGNLAIVALRLLDAIQPLTRRFAEWIATLTVGAEKATDTRKEMDGLRGFFKRAGDAAAQLGRIFGNLFDILGSLGRAALPAGRGLLDSFEKATQKLSEFLDRPKNQRELVKFFNGASRNFRALSSLIGAIVLEVLKLGDNRGIRQFARGVEPAVKIFGDIGDRMVGAGPALAGLVVQAARLVKAFTDTGAITTFLNVLTAITKAAADFATSPIGSKIILYATLFGAFSRAIALALKPISFFARAILGGPIKVIGFLWKSLRLLFPNLASLGTIFGRLGGLLLRFAGPIGIIIALLPLFIRGIKQVYAQSPELRKFIDTIINGFKSLGPVIESAGHWLGDVLPPVIQFLGEAFDKWISNVVVPVVNTFFKVVNHAMPIIGKIIKALFTAIKFFITRIFIPYWKNILIPAIKLLLKIAIPVFRTVWNAAKNLFTVIKFLITRVFIPVWKNVLWPAIKGLWTVAKTVFKWVLDKWKDIIAGIKSVWERVLRPTIDRIKDKFQDLREKVADVVNGIKDKFNDFRDKLADVWGWVRDRVNEIKGKFGEIKDAVANAFDKLDDKAKGGINTFIKFLNDKLISKINSVTSKFGLTISPIPTLAEGGRPGVPDSGGRVRGMGGSKDDRVPTMVSPNEYVTREAAARRVGYDTMAYINRHGKLPPMGDRGSGSSLRASGSLSNAKDSAGIFGLGKAWDTIEKLAAKGVGFTLEKLVLGAKGLMGAAGLGYEKGKGFTLTNFFHKIMEKLAEAAKDWGKTKQDEAERRAMPVGGGGADINVISPSNPRATQSWHGGVFTRLFIAHLTKAQKVAGVYIPVTQGGFRPTTSYSGSTHNMDAIDTIVNYKILYALRRVGIAAGDRTGLGNWGPHVHAIPGPGAGYGSPSAMGQWADYVRRGGRKQSPGSPWGLATGGLISPRSGGINAIIGEGSRPERVEPLDREGFSKRDRAILDAIRDAIGSNKGGGNQIVINPSQGMDERELGEYILRRQTFNMRRGV